MGGRIFFLYHLFIFRLMTLKFHAFKRVGKKGDKSKGKNVSLISNYLDQCLMYIK